MLYFFDIYRDKERICDPEGSEIPTFAEAMTEAERIARDIATEELSNGRALSSSWHVAIRGADKVLSMISIQNAALGRNTEQRQDVIESSLASDFQEKSGFLIHYHRSRLLIEESRQIVQNVRSTFEQIRSQLAELD